MRPQHSVTVANNNIVLDAQQDRQVDVHLASARLEDAPSGETVVRLTVDREDGSQAFYFLSVRLSKQGRLIAELIAKKPDGSEVAKSVHGYWKPPRAPRTEV